MKNTTLPDTGAFKHSFRVQGTTYTLFKIKQSRLAPWYIRVEKSEKVIKRCLNTPDAVLAEKAAKVVIAEVKQQNWTRLATFKTRKETTPEKSLTLGEVFTCYQDKLTKNEPISRKSVYRTWSSWVSILKRTHPDADPSSFPIAEVNEDLASKFRDILVGEYLKKIDENDNQVRDKALEKAYVTGRSLCNQAASLFKKSRIPIYRKEYALGIPDSALKFLPAASQAFKRHRQMELMPYDRPSDEIIAKTFKFFEDLDTADMLNRNMFLAFWFAVGTALRRSEMANLKWEHIVVKNGKFQIDSEYKCKGGELLKGPILAEGWKMIAPYRKQSGFILEGNKTEREEEVFDRIGVIMRSHGWRTEKTYHEIRKFVGSKVAEKLGVLAAAQLLRHKDTEVLIKFYLHYLNPPNYDIVCILPKHNGRESTQMGVPQPTSVAAAA